jgi:hypothetical protein
VIKKTIQIAQGAKVGPEQRPIYGYKEVTAYCEGGLAVHRRIGKERWHWIVSHEASGLALGVIGAMTKARAVENMRATLALGFDWTRDEQATIAALRAADGILPAMRKIGESY